MNNKIVFDLELDADKALSLVQLVKRVGWTDIREKAIDNADAIGEVSRTVAPAHQRAGACFNVGRCSLQINNTPP